VSNAEAIPVESGHQRRVRRQRQRHGRDRGVEAHAALRERVERGRVGALGTLGADMIGAQRVDRQQQNAR
jgi:hypothetical protein